MTNAVAYIRNSLKDIYSDSEISIFIRIIMEYILKTPYHITLSDKSNKIKDEHMDQIKEIVCRLKESEPIQYIIGNTEFLGLSFFVNKDVLIPRPETEELVELILDECRIPNPDVLDIGTGSGCIAISLAKMLKNANISAWDISATALDVAGKNAILNAVNIHFTETDVLSGNFQTGYKFDIVVSNPPYVLESDKTDMDKNVLDYEPDLALFVDDDRALIFYERIADLGHSLLKEDGKLYFEIHHRKGFEVINMLKTKGYEDITLHKDLSGNDRMVKAVLRKSI